MAPQTEKRGAWAERYVRDFLALPFVSEFVFHSPQTTDHTQKEVADFLIAYPGMGLLLSQKTQQDPFVRTPAKTLSWALKESRNAARQLCGALRNAGRPIWCEHPRRGRVDFAEGLPEIRHGLVLAEVFGQVDLNEIATDLPLRYQSIPITYLSLNDFLNVAMELRTIPEVLAYLDARRALPYTDLRIIGDERSLFEFYLLQGGSLAGCLGKADAAIAVAAQRDDLKWALESKAENDHYSGLVEQVADQLSTRRPDYADGLSLEALERYDPPGQRTNYLKMQAVLANLGLRVRSELGRAFEDTVRQRQDMGSDFLYRAMHVESSPEWVYVFASSAGIAPGDLERRKMPLMIGALAHFQKTHCLIIMDRDHAGYEVGLTTVPSCLSSPTERALGDRYFGHLRMTHRPLTLVPE